MIYSCSLTLNFCIWLCHKMIDLRMIDEKWIPRYRQLKLCQMYYYQKYDAQKGMQFIFSDLGTYKPGRVNLFENQAAGGRPTISRPMRYASFKSEKAKKAMVNHEPWGHSRYLRFYIHVGHEVWCTAAVWSNRLDTPWPSDLGACSVIKEILLQRGLPTTGQWLFMPWIARWTVTVQPAMVFHQPVKDEHWGRTMTRGRWTRGQRTNFQNITIFRANTVLWKKARLDKDYLPESRRRTSSVVIPMTGQAGRVKFVSFQPKTKSRRLIERLFEACGAWWEGVPISKLTIKGGGAAPISKTVLHVCRKWTKAPQEYNKISMAFLLWI